MTDDNPLQDRRGAFFALLAVTLVRIPIALTFALLLIFIDHGPVLLVSCALLLGLIELTDVMDGLMARKYGLVTEWGAMLDPYSDSSTRLLVYWGLAVSGLALPFVPLVMAMRDVAVAYCRIVMSSRGKTVSARLSGKIKAVVQGTLAPVLVLGPLYWPYVGEWTMPVLSIIVAVVTAWSVSHYFTGAVEAARGE